jgi:hypothetical protein
VALSGLNRILTIKPVSGAVSVPISVNDAASSRRTASWETDTATALPSGEAAKQVDNLTLTFLPRPMHRTLENKPFEGVFHRMSSR